MLWRSRSPISFFKFESIQEIFWMTIPYTGCDPRSITLLYFNPTVATEQAPTTIRRHIILPCAS